MAEAKLLLAAARNLGSLNRAYHAMFYAVLALLADTDETTSKHAGVISLFDRLFVKPGVFERELSFWLHKTFEQRLRGDYDASTASRTRKPPPQSTAPSVS